MPISVKTMRDIWDEERIKKKEEKEMRRKRIRAVGGWRPEAVRKEYLDYLKVREKSLAEIRKYLLDYLERKKYATEIFDFIESYLGDAGFSKI